MKYCQNLSTYFILFLLLFCLLFACKPTQTLSFFTIEEAPAPPGTIKIGNNLYVDRAEASNFMYLEYLAWLNYIYGENSEEYIQALPKSDIWKKLNSNYANLDSIYLRLPSYSTFPVVGVSFEQAKKYTKWRSDRVMEVMLRKMGVISKSNTNSKDSIFTIKKYFNGEYYGIQPDSNFLVYPHFTLPDSTIFKKASLYAETLFNDNLAQCEKKCSDYFFEINCKENKKDVSEFFPKGSTPLMSTTCDQCDKELITHLEGNVREMTNIEGLFYGTSFLDSCDSPKNTFSKDNQLTNSYTGFRNACEYRKWNYND